MTIRPGRNLVRVAGGLAAAALVTFFWPGAFWLLVAALVPLAVLAALDYRLVRHSLDQVTLERSLPAVAGRNLPFRVVLKVAHSGGQSLEAELRDESPAAATPVIATRRLRLPVAGAGEILTTEFRIPVRGAFEFGPVWLRLAGKFGVLEGQRSIPCTGRVKVLPEGFCSPEGLRHDERAQLLMLDKASRVRQHGAGTEFEMLSEYRPGDDPRRIDWRTTARFRRPVVRRFQIERHRDVMIVIDCGRLMGADAGRGTKLDCAVDAALMLGRTALEGGDRCGLALFDDQVLRYLPPVSGVRSMRALAEGVYDVQSRWRESDFSRMFATLQSRQAKRSLMVILSDIVDVETTTRFRASLATLGHRHVVLFAALQTPLLRELVHAPVTNELDGSRLAVTFRILREREQALHSLSRSGVNVLDVEPSRLTVPLINRFLELRQGTML
ncbi:MAG: DUF58 domain-containing protein [Planctomycetaceae bacterium]|nr:DUF58 domain-containing protein [Planctomycetaceae bacterium]